MILKALDRHDARLRQSCADVPRADLRLREVQLEIQGLLGFVEGVASNTTKSAKPKAVQPRTIGLSANQVGIIKRICVVDMAVGRSGYHDVRVLVNPRIVWASKSTASKAEGCVNLPTIWGMVERPRSVRVAALDRSGNEIEMKLTGWPAVLLQHEIDHLDGKLFIDKLKDAHKAHLVEDDDYPAYRRQKAQDWHKFIDVTDMVVE